MSFLINKSVWCVAVYFKDKNKKENVLFSVNSFLSKFEEISEIHFKCLNVTSTKEVEDDFSSYTVNAFLASDSSGNSYLYKSNNSFVRCFYELSTLSPVTGDTDVFLQNLKDKQAYPFLFVLTDLLDFISERILDSNELNEKDNSSNILNSLLNQIKERFENETSLKLSSFNNKFSKSKKWIIQ